MLNGIQGVILCDNTARVHLFLLTGEETPRKIAAVTFKKMVCAAFLILDAGTAKPCMNSNNMWEVWCTPLE